MAVDATAAEAGPGREAFGVFGSLLSFLLCLLFLLSEVSFFGFVVLVEWLAG
jgi:hypothetical protein